MRPLAGSREEGGALGGVVAELMTEDAEGARCIAEAASDFVGGELLDVVGRRASYCRWSGDSGARKNRACGSSVRPFRGLIGMGGGC